MPCRKNPAADIRIFCMLGLPGISAEGLSTHCSMNYDYETDMSVTVTRQLVGFKEDFRGEKMGKKTTQILSNIVNI